MSASNFDDDRAGRQGNPQSDGAESVRTVLIALAANLGIALAKVVAALLSRSSAMLAEAFHAFADAGNQVLLLVAQRRGALPPDAHNPLGHGREAYFWALIASLAVFVTGALLSVRQGIDQLLHPQQVSSYLVTYSVLLVSLVLESVSLRRAYRQIRAEADNLSRDFLEHLDVSSDPIGRAVFAEDAAAVAGNCIAGIGIMWHQLSGSAIPDAVAAIVIGTILAYVAWQLARRNAQFLVGRQAPAPIEAQVRETISRQLGVRGVQELLVIFVGPRRLWVLARIEIDDSATGATLKVLASDTEMALRTRSRSIVRVDIVPRGAR